MICDGCTREGASELLFLRAPLGDCCVRVHPERECANAARVLRGGGRFLPREDETLARPVSRADRLLLCAVTEEVKRLRRRT